MTMTIRKRKMVFEIKRRRTPQDNGGKHSPCRGCIREFKSKNKGACAGCPAPLEYAILVEERTPYIKAIDYTDPMFVVSKGEVVRAVLDGYAVYN